MPTLRKTRLSRAQEKVRGVRLRRNHNHQELRVADKDASKAKNKLDRFFIERCSF
jgi:hypothetical protein